MSTLYRNKLLLWIFPFFALFSRDGLIYKHDQNFCSIHVLEIDPSQYDIIAVRAEVENARKESVLSLCKKYGAIGGVNGGFFKANGDPAGALKIQQWCALPQKPRACIGWSNPSKHPKIDRLLTSIRMHKNFESFLIDGLNRERKKGEAILYTKTSRNYTETYDEGEEIVILNNQVVEIRKECNTLIPSTGCVLSIEKSNPLFGTFQVGMNCSYEFEIESKTGFTQPSDWTQLDYIVGGCPLLLTHQRKIWDFEFEQITVPSFITKTHARTAIGFLPNGHWVFVVVEQLDEDDLDGMSLPDLASYMDLLGCTDALNLDGGSSSTLVLDHEIKNSIKGDKKVSDAILIIPRKQPEANGKITN